MITWRGGAVCVLIAAVMLTAAYLGSPVMMGALLILIQIPIGSFLLILWSRRVRIEQSVSHRAVRHGDPVVYQLRITQRKWRPAVMLRMKLRLQDAEGLTRLRRRDEYLLPKQPVQQKIRIVCHRRGHYAVGLARLQLSDGFMCFRLPVVSGRRLNQELTELTIWPRPLTVHPNAPFMQTVEHDSNHQRPPHRDDIDRPAGLRSYQQGDPLKRIHWKLTARFQSIQIREFDQPARPEIRILADHQLAAQTPHRGLDHIADYAAGYAEAFLKQGQLVSLSSYHSGQRQTVAAQTIDQLDDLLWLLTDLKSGETVPMEWMLRQETDQGGPDCPICVVTARSDDSMLDALSRLRRQQHPVLFCRLAEAGVENPPAELQARLQEDDILMDWLPWPVAAEQRIGEMTP